MARKDRSKEREFDEKFRERKVGDPFSTDRDLVEQGEQREGTNLDLGEERSPEQLEEMEKAREEKEKQ